MDYSRLGSMPGLANYGSSQMGRGCSKFLGLYAQGTRRQPMETALGMLDYFFLNPKP